MFPRPRRRPFAVPPSAPSRSRRPAAPCGPLAPRSIPLTPTRAARAWRFTLNAGPLPPVPQRRARALSRGERGTRQRRRNEAAKGREQSERRQGGREEPSFSRSPSPLFHATYRGENRPKIRGYETRRANAREVRATKKISSIPGFRSRPPAAPRRVRIRPECTVLVRVHVYSTPIFPAIWEISRSQPVRSLVTRSRLFYSVCRVFSPHFSFFFFFFHYYTSNARSFNGCNNEDTLLAGADCRVCSSITPSKLVSIGL